MMIKKFLEECARCAEAAAGAASRELLSVIAASDEDLNIDEKF